MKAVKLKYDQGAVSRFKTNLTMREQRARDAGFEGVQNTAEFVFEMAQESVPVVSGALRDSGKVTMKKEPYGTKGIIGYGDSTVNDKGEPTSEYAVDRHEMFNPHKPESYKWLERAMRTTGSDLFISEVARLIRDALT